MELLSGFGIELAVWWLRPVDVHRHIYLAVVEVRGRLDDPLGVLGGWDVADAGISQSGVGLLRSVSDVYAAAFGQIVDYLPADSNRWPSVLEVPR